jgi:hypothetical protein
MEYDNNHFIIASRAYFLQRLILCLQQTGEIDNLIVSWGKVLVVLCAGSTLLLVKSHAPAFFWRHCLECRKASGH